MKKGLIGLILLLIPFIIFGCQKKTEEDKKPVKPITDQVDSAKHISDYFPFVQDTIMHYKGVGNEYAQKNVSVDYIKNNRIQLRTDNGGTVAISVLENSNGELKLIYTRGEAYYRLDLTECNGAKSEILLKEPLEKGTSWTINDSANKRYISEVDKEINTPLGSYKTLVVTTEYEKDIAHDYYAEGIGLVKTEFITNGETISSTIEKLDKNTAVSETIRFYYPFFNTDKLAYIDRSIKLNTNESIIASFENYMKEKPNSDLSKVLSQGVVINKLTLDAIKNQVDIDFSSNLVTDMNAGSGFEGMILQSITNTLGGYFGTDQVYITLDGKPYSSGHFAMSKNETFDVDLKDSIKYE